ncbi:MAG: hypothetical protein QM755_06385 [Luteolibacter sp.]
MLDDFLARIFTSQWTIFLVASALLLILAEAGYRFGTMTRQRNPEAAEGHSGSVQGAVLGLLGLLLGFTFAMSVSRYDTRRALLVNEANSIGTTWLRAGFLGEPRTKEVRSLLKRYTEIRLEADEKSRNEQALRALVVESTNIQNALWAVAEHMAGEKPDAITASFITTLNETIDLQSSRLAARRNHVPGAVWLLLFTVAGCGAWASGYGSGTGGHRSAFSQLVFPLLIGVVVTLIADIDRPDKGLVGVSQQPMKDLLEGMK